MKQNASLRCHQVRSFVDLYTSYYHIEPSLSIISYIFQIHSTQVTRELEYVLSPQSPPFKQPLLSTDQELEVLNFIEESYFNYQPARKIDILAFARKISQKDLSDNWVYSFLKRHSTEVVTKEAVPIEEVRTNIDPEYVEKYIDELILASEDVPSELFFNLDESSNSASSSSKNYSSVIPTKCSDHLCYFSFDRSQKNITSLVNISLAGDLIPSVIIIPSQSVPIILDQSGLRDGIEFHLCSSENGFITFDIFYSYLEDIFIPTINKIRIEKNYHEKPALLLMDNCSCHINFQINRLLASHNIRVITYPPHTSHLFQPLDAVFFGCSKKNVQRKTGIADFLPL